MVDLVNVGVLAILAGFVLIILATMFSSKVRDGEAEERRAEVKGGGVIMIGPIPIIIGSDAKWASIAAILAIILVVASFIFMRYAA